MNKLRSILFLLAGLFFVLIMVHFIGFESVLEVLTEIDLLLFAAAISCQGCALLLWAVRWKILVRPFHPIQFRNSLKGIIIGMFFNNITPVARAGGEPFRAYFLERKEGVDFEDAFATVAVDRILDSFPFLIIIIISLAYFVLLLEINLQVIIIISLALIFNVILLSLVLYFSFSLKAAKKLVFSIFRIAVRFSSRLEKYESQVEKAIEQYYGAIRTLSSREGDLAVCLAISFLFWFTAILRNYLVVLSLGYEVDFMVIVVVQMVGTLVGILPILPGGLGSIDGVMVFLYYSFRFPVAVAMTASLMDRFISFWIMLAVGVVVVIFERKFLEGL